MSALPNPFLNSPLEASLPGETAAAPDLTDPPDAAADRFVLDEAAFMDAIEPAPLFLSDPRPEYLDAIPDAVMAVLAGY